jgi:hypothetical protein
MPGWHVAASCLNYRLITPFEDDKELWKKLAVISSSAALSVDLFRETLLINLAKPCKTYLRGIGT